MNINRNPWRKRCAEAAILLLAVTGCASTKVQEQWRDPNYQTAGPQKAFVLALTAREERRRAIEDQLVRRLRDAGIDAVPSYQTLSFVGPGEIDKVKRAVQETGSTLALTVRLLKINQEAGFTSGAYKDASGFSSYYGSATAGVQEPGEMHVYNVYRTETRVFDAKSEKMIWAGMIDVPEPNDLTQSAATYADLVVKRLRDDKILG